MKKKPTSKQQREKEQKEAALLEKIKSEKNSITAEIKSVFKTAEMVSVEPEFKEVSFDVYPEEFGGTQRDFSTKLANFKFERADKTTDTLYFSYALKPQQ